MPEKQRIQLADQLKTMGHPLRLKILILLLQQSAQPVSVLQQQLGAEQSLVSHHLTKLKDYGVLTSQRQSQQIHYSVVNPELIKSILQLLGLRVRQDEGSADNLVATSL